MVTVVGAVGFGSALALAIYAQLHDDAWLGGAALVINTAAYHATYVELYKRRLAIGRPRTWVAITDRGRSAFAGHLAELQRLAAQAPSPEPP